MVFNLTKVQIERLLSVSAVGVVNETAIVTAVKHLSALIKDKRLYIYSAIDRSARDFCDAINVESHSRLRPNEIIYHLPKNCCVVTLTAYITSPKYVKHNIYLEEYLNSRPDLDIWRIYNWR